jgi:hypothetical protein
MSMFATSFATSPFVTGLVNGDELEEQVLHGPYSHLDSWAWIGPIPPSMPKRKSRGGSHSAAPPSGETSGGHHQGYVDPQDLVLQPAGSAYYPNATTTNTLDPALTYADNDTFVYDYNPSSFNYNINFDNNVGVSGVEASTGTGYSGTM